MSPAIKQLLSKWYDAVTLPLCRQPRILRVLDRLLYQRRRVVRQIVEQRLRAAGEYGDEIQRGPFAGMKYLPPERYASFRFEKIVGTYEHELHAWLAEVVATPRYATILNIGAAEGFYTAGLARLFPSARVVSYESLEYNRDYCRDLLLLNGAADRVEIHATCTLDDLRALNPAGPVLVVMDIDLGERQFLDPGQIPWLRQAEVLVETHECLRGGEGTNQLLRDRFAPSHAIRQVTSAGLRYADYPLLRPLLFNEIHALVGDDRRGVQDWLLMQPLP